MKNKILLLLILFAFLNCKKETQKESSNQHIVYDVDESYKILNIALRKNVGLLSPQIKPSKNIKYGSTEYKKFYDSLIAEKYFTYHLDSKFLEFDTLEHDENFEHIVLKDNIDLEKINILPIAKRIDSIPCKSNPILEQCPDNFLGSITLSKVIFNKNQTRAHMQITYMCGRVCGYTKDLVFTKRNNLWNIFEEKNMSEY